MKQAKLILFGNGSYYSIAVLSNLLERGIVPLAVVLPEFPPATTNKSADINVDAGMPTNKLTEIARRLSIPLIYAPRALKSALSEQLVTFNADYILVACWPYLLPADVVSSVNSAALNLHPSLLPKYRGPAPVAEQLACNEARLGVTLHRLSQDFDCGDIVSQAGFQLKSGSVGGEQIEAEAALIGTGLFVAVMRGDSGAG